MDEKLFSNTRKKQLKNGFKKGKVVNEVLDKPTVMALYKLITDHIIAYVNGSVSAGKESVVFWAVDDNNVNVALKIYLVSTSNFKKREAYILGDPRFLKLKKGTQNLVFLWAKKEFKNLLRCFDSGIPVPKPIHVSRNILSMEFVGKNGAPCKILLIKNLYTKAKLVHGDFSEYNIFKTEKGLVLFDLGSAVDLKHPNTVEFLKRDINNITKFFSKRGIAVKDPEKVLREIIS